MTRRVAAALLVPAALLGWAVLALAGWWTWTHPGTAFLLVVTIVLGVVLGHRRHAVPTPTQADRDPVVGRARARASRG